MGITNCVANIISIIAPLAVGFIVHEEVSAEQNVRPANTHNIHQINSHFISFVFDTQTNVTQWRTVFFVAAFVYFIGNLLFVLFSKAEMQPWNDAQKLHGKNAAWHYCLKDV